MPVGYWCTVAFISWGIACALSRWRRLGSFSAIPALLASELPFIVGYLLIASTVLALVDGDLDSPGGVAGAAVALLALAGLIVIVCRALRAHAALRNAGKPRRPRGRILRAPFFPGRLDVVRLQPHVTLADQVADVRDAIDWVRTHAAEFGAEPGMLFVAGSSAGAYLAIIAACQGETGIAGLICRYGYYGDLAPRGDMPPMLVVHGEKDMLISAADVRGFAERVRAVSSHPVIYAELPGAHHDFDMFESIRSAAVNKAVEQFTARISAFSEANDQDGLRPG